VRDKQGSLIRYSPGDVPARIEDVQAFLRIELDKIQSALNATQDGNLDEITVAPEKPRNGMLRRADGTQWNPGSGQGVYCYYAASWHFLG
jgi:hypothetical protein